jgi:hypothetical protein
MAKHSTVRTLIGMSARFAADADGQHAVKGVAFGV